METSMNAFEIVLVAVCVVSTLIAGAAWLRVGQLYDQIGWTGRLSFEHEGGLSAEKQPDAERDHPPGASTD
jgi:hypothetical protein